MIEYRVWVRKGEGSGSGKERGRLILALTLSLSSSGRQKQKKKRRKRRNKTSVINEIKVISFHNALLPLPMLPLPLSLCVVRNDSLAHFPAATAHTHTEANLCYSLTHTCSYRCSLAYTLTHKSHKRKTNG